jgi:hypothetical protein
MKKVVVSAICFVMVIVTFCAGAFFLKKMVFEDQPAPIEKTLTVIEKEEIYLPGFTLVSEEIDMDQLSKAKSTSKFWKIKKDISFLYKVTAVMGSKEKPPTIVQDGVATVFLPRIEVLYITAPTDIRLENLNTGNLLSKLVFGDVISIDTIVEALTVDEAELRDWIENDEKTMSVAISHFKELYEEDLKDLNPQITTVNWE